MEKSTREILKTRREPQDNFASWTKIKPDEHEWINEQMNADVRRQERNVKTTEPFIYKFVNADKPFLKFVIHFGFFGPF